MRYAAGHKEQTRARILKAAGRIFRRQGYHAAGVDKVMEEAGLTAGGFYAHFASKEALLSETLTASAKETHAFLDQGLTNTAGPERVEAFIDRYLSESHLSKAEEGCPLPALLSEISRSNEDTKTCFQTILQNLAGLLRSDAGESQALGEDQAFAILALCVGGLGVARSVHDEAMASRILEASRALAKGALASVSEPKTSTIPAHKRKKS